MKVELFEGKALAAALRDSGYDVSDRTVQRWKAGEIAPKPQDVAAIRRVLELPDTTKEAPPHWAVRLLSRVDEIYDRQAKVGNEMSNKVIEALAPLDRLEQAAIAIRELESLVARLAEASDDPPVAPGQGGGSQPDQEAG